MAICNFLDLISTLDHGAVDTYGVPVSNEGIVVSVSMSHRIAPNQNIRLLFFQIIIYPILVKFIGFLGKTVLNNFPTGIFTPISAIIFRQILILLVGL